MLLRILTLYMYYYLDGYGIRMIVYIVSFIILAFIVVVIP